jgi:hypothetical protein
LAIEFINVDVREGVNFALAEIDLTYLDQIRESMPVRQQLKTSLYGDIRIQNTGTSNSTGMSTDEIESIFVCSVADPG